MARGGGENHVGDVQADELGGPKAGLQGDQQQVPVAPPDPRGQVRCRQQRPRLIGCPWRDASRINDSTSRWSGWMSARTTSLMVLAERRPIRDRLDFFRARVMKEIYSWVP